MIYLRLRALENSTNMSSTNNNYKGKILNVCTADPNEFNFTRSYN